MGAPSAAGVCKPQRAACTLIFLVFALAGPALAQSTIYVGKTVALVVPPGQCILGNSFLERSILDRTAKAMAGYNYVLAAFGACEEVRQSRAGRSVPFSSFG